jgi:hypothetical protein
MTRGISSRGAVPRGAKRAIRTGLALASLVAVATPALAAGPPIISSATTTATVVRPLTLVKITDLDFGNIIAGTTAGTVTVSAINGTRTRTGGTILPLDVGQPASFAGMGARGQRVSLRVSANTVTLTRVGGTQTMTMNTFTINSSPATTLTTTPRNFTIAAPTGVFNFNVGATLNVGANQTAGTYRGQFTVTLIYQ